VIIALAGSFSFVTYQYSTYVSNSITKSSTQAIHTDAQIQASNMANVVSDELDSVATNLQVVANSEPLQQADVPAVTSMLQSAQNSTSSFTSAYSWIDQTGALLTSTKSNVSLADEQAINFTDRPYFAGAKDTGVTFVTGALVNLITHRVQIVVAQPIYLGGHNFKGVVTCSINLPALGALLKSQLAPQFQSSMGLIDVNGTILYTNNQNITGMNVFSDQFQELLPVGLKSSFDSFLNASLTGKAGVEDLSYQGSTGTIAYQPVLVETTPDSSTKPEFFGVLYISAANVLATSQARQISQLRDFTILILLGIDASAVGGAFIVIRWNKSLDRIVRERTAELARANQDLVSRDEAQKDFLNIAVHELRTPVQPLVILGEMMKESVSEGKTELTQMQVEMVDRSTKRLERLTKTLLDLTRIDTDTLKLSKEKFDLNDEVRKVIAELSAATVSQVVRPPSATTGNSVLMVGMAQQQQEQEPSSLSGGAGYAADGDGGDRDDGAVRRASRDWHKDSGYGIFGGEPRVTHSSQVRFAPSPGQLLVYADSTRIFEVIANLLRNAQTFSRGKDIEISTQREGGDAIVRVRDHGNGIDPEVMPRLFTKFASKSTSGMGLGLYISKKLVEAHGGKISAENNADGMGGATICFTLPLAS
jgi:signal transduction histidine kinase